MCAYACGVCVYVCVCVRGCSEALVSATHAPHAQHHVTQRRVECAPDVLHGQPGATGHREGELGLAFDEVDELAERGGRSE